MSNVFNLTQAELDELLKPRVKQLVDDSFKKAGYILYRDARCTTEEMFVREFQDGRKELLRMDAGTMTCQLVEVIQ